MCTCDAGRWGSTCENDCPGGEMNSCNNHGMCGLRGTCACSAGWTGWSCGRMLGAHGLALLARLDGSFIGSQVRPAHARVLKSTRSRVARLCGCVCAVCCRYCCALCAVATALKPTNVAVLVRREHPSVTQAAIGQGCAWYLGCWRSVAMGCSRWLVRWVFAVSDARKTV